MTVIINDIRVRVKPNVRKELVQEGKKGVLEVAVNAPAKANRANERMKTLVAGYFSVSVAKVSLIRGMNQPLKTIRIRP